MVKLTQDMVIARSKTSDLETVTKLNFWGSDLNDISIVRKFQNVEILSFSLNMISTLAPFQYCKNLTELYIRRNRIQDLREICYLQDLPLLKTLLLSENPCCETAGDLYRPTVIRALPNLELLDNIEVTTSDREYALQLGLILEQPGQREKEHGIVAGTRFYEIPLVDKASTYYDELLSQRNSCMKTTCNEPHHECSKRPLTATSKYPIHLQAQSSHLTPPPQEASLSYQQSPGCHLLSSSPSSSFQMPIPQQQQQPQEFYPRNQEYSRQHRGGPHYPDMKMANSYSHVLDAYSHLGSQPTTPCASPRRAPKNRNLLSAVLCLISELDGDSLDLVDLAVKKRRNEILM